MNLVLWGRNLAAAGLLASVFVSSTMAQGPGGRGFGGGMMGMGRGGGAFSLLRMEEVRKELKVDDEQTKKLTDLGEKLRAEVQKSSPFGGGPGGGGTNFQDMSDEERAEFRKKMEEASKKSAEITKNFEKQIDDILDPIQQERLLGLIVQREGVRSVASNAKVAEAIAADAKQLAEMEKIEKEASDRQRAAFQPGANGERPDFEAMRTKMEEARKETEKKLTAVLTAPQQKKLEDLKGAKFEFPERGPGGPGGGRGGRGGGRPGNNN